MKVRFTPIAREQFLAIIRTIAADRPMVAKRFATVSKQVRQFLSEALAGLPDEDVRQYCRERRRPRRVGKPL